MCPSSNFKLPRRACSPALILLQTFGEQNTEAEAHEMLSYVAECGVNFLVSILGGVE